MDWSPVRHSLFTSLYTSYSRHTRMIETNVLHGKVYLWNTLFNLGHRAEHVILDDALSLLFVPSGLFGEDHGRSPVYHVSHFRKRRISKKKKDKNQVDKVDNVSERVNIREPQDFR